VSRTEQSIDLVVVDIDNTLYDWVEFFVPAFEAMVSAVATYIGATRETLIDQYRDLYREHGSLEYAFVTQALPATARLHDNERSLVVAYAHDAFHRARVKHLRLYDGVREALEEVRLQQRSLVAATNAPLYQAQRRLQQLEIAELFDGVAAKKSYEIPEDDPTITHLLKRARQGDYEPRIARHWGLDDDQLKPSPAMYSLVVRDMGVQTSKTLVVGDSLVRDVLPGLRIGTQGAWAQYGTHLRRDLLEVLLTVTPWSTETVTQHYAGDKDSSMVPSLARFDEILQLI
jgi:phosphoglycolate phosphatase